MRLNVIRILSAKSNRRLFANGTGVRNAGTWVPAEPIFALTEQIITWNWRVGMGWADSAWWTDMEQAWSKTWAKGRCCGHCTLLTHIGDICHWDFMGGGACTPAGTAMGATLRFRKKHMSWNLDGLGGRRGERGTIIALRCRTSPLNIFYRRNLATRTTHSMGVYLLLHCFDMGLENEHGDEQTYIAWRHLFHGFAVGVALNKDSAPAGLRTG